MRANRAILAAVGALAVLSAVGCEDRSKSVSDSDYLLDLQHTSWDNARKTLASDNPQLNILRAVHTLLTQRTPRRIGMDYTGPNKDEVVAKLKSLGDKYNADVASKLDFQSPVVRLRPGATLEQVREAFMALDPEYREFEVMTGKK